MTGERFVRELRSYSLELCGYGTALYLYEHKVSGYKAPPAVPEYGGPTPSAVLGGYLDAKLGFGATPDTVRQAMHQVAAEHKALAQLDELWRGSRPVVTEALTRLGRPQWDKVTTPDEAARLVLDEVWTHRRIEDADNVRKLEAKGVL